MTKKVKQNLEKENLVIPQLAPTFKDAEKMNI